MLTSEYFVLDGATSLAFPTFKGQSLLYEVQGPKSNVSWKSYDHLGNVWFETVIDCETLVSSNQNKVGLKLEQVLSKARDLNSEFLREGGTVEVRSDFNLQWGFGSSSTLVSLIAQWANVDPYKIQFDCFGGSGYDIACAQAKSPILYNRLPKPKATPLQINYPFKNQLYFVYLGQKQDSREGIKHYRSMENSLKKEIIQELNQITERLTKCGSLDAFCNDLKRHEELVGNAIQTTPVQERLFSDFNGQTKSLGAWGGDFILAASHEQEREVFKYFHTKGFDTVLRFRDTVFNGH